MKGFNILRYFMISSLLFYAACNPLWNFFFKKGQWTICELVYYFQLLCGFVLSCITLLSSMMLRSVVWPM